MGATQLGLHSEVDFDFDAAEKVPANAILGPCSWNYPGWRGTIYQDQYRNEKEFQARCLNELSRFPWFRTVEIDSTFYTPPAVETLKHYASLVPKDFRWVSKVWEAVTIPVYGRHARYGKRAGTKNPHFLDANFFCDQVLARYSRENKVLQHTGPFLFQFQSFPRSEAKQPSPFLRKLENFLSALPTEFEYAVEVRNPELLSPDYFQVLNQHRVAHCFNHWTKMPPLITQMRKAAEAGGLESEFYFARALTPLGVSFQDAIERFHPYRTLQAPNQQMRNDVVRILKRALQKEKRAYILVNNRSEGNSPLTIEAIGKQLLSELESNSR